MDQKVLPYARRRQILAVLAEHGPLSVRAMEYIIAPEMERRRLRDSVQRLHRQGILYKRAKCLDMPTCFYQIKQSPLARRKAAAILGCTPESLYLPHFRRINLLNSVVAALWTTKLARIFPDALVQRRNQVPASTWTSMGLQHDSFLSKWLPDMLISWPAETVKVPLRIAVFLEYDGSTTENFLKKLKLSSPLNGIDGILMIASDWLLDTKFNEALTSRSIKREIKKRLIGPNLFCTTSHDFMLSKGPPNVTNAALETVPLPFWIRLLHEIKAAEHQNTESKRRGHPC